MSLHALAKHMAAQGRGPDTTLVHMAPTELASLQDLAQRHGGSLTLNPHTGLPEAGYLSALLPMALGAAAEFLPGMHGIGAGMVGAGIGAIHGLGSGSLSQGLLAGLSAYSGAGLAGGLLGSGIAAENPEIRLQMKQLQEEQAKAVNKALAPEIRAAAEEQAAKLSEQLQQAQTTALNKESRGFMDNLSTAGKGFSGGFKNFQTSMGTTPGAFGPKTTLAAGLAPLLLSGADESQAQNPAVKSTDSDRGAYANSGATFRPNWVGPYGNKNPGGERTYAMPYYGAEGGVTHMAEGGMAEGGMPKQDAYQEYMDYLNAHLPSSQAERQSVTPFEYATPEEVANPVNTPAPAMQYAPRGETRAPGNPNAGTNAPFSPLSPIGTPQNGSLGFQAADAFGNPVVGAVLGLANPVLGLVSLAARQIANNMLPAELSRELSRTQALTAQSIDAYSKGLIGGEGGPTSSPGTFGGGGYGTPVSQGGYGVTSPTGMGFAANPHGVDPATAQGQTVTGQAAAAAASGNTGRGGGSGLGGVGLGGIGASSVGSPSAPGMGGGTGVGSVGASAGSVGSVGGTGIGIGSPAAPGMGGGTGLGGIGIGLARGGGISDLYNLGSYSDGGRLLRGPGDGVSDSIPAVIGQKQPARLADGEFVVPARIVSEIGNGSTEAGARKLYAMMDRVQKARGNTMGKGKVAKNSRADRYLPA